MTDHGERRPTLGHERLLRLRRQTRSAPTSPRHDRQSGRSQRGVAAAVAVSLALAVLTYGAVTGRSDAATVGLIATAVSASAIAARGRNRIRAAERSAQLRDTALAESERNRRDLQSANERLQRKNAELLTLQITVAHGFKLIDERTEGRLWELVHEAGNDLAALVDETLNDED
jgi:hypothetical protein